LLLLVAGWLRHAATTLRPQRELEKRPLACVGPSDDYSTAPSARYRSSTPTDEMRARRLLIIGNAVGLLT
jgi:hypothetical protein